MKNPLKYIIVGILVFYGYNTFKHPDSRASLQTHEIYDMLGNHLMDATDALLQRRDNAEDSATQIPVAQSVASLSSSVPPQPASSPKIPNASPASQEAAESDSPAVIGTPALGYWPGEPVNGYAPLISHPSPAQQAAWKDGPARYDAGERDYARLAAANLNRQAQFDLTQQTGRINP